MTRDSSNHTLDPTTDRVSWRRWLGRRGCGGAQDAEVPLAPPGGAPPSEAERAAARAVGGGARDTMRTDSVLFVLCHGSYS